MSFKFR